MEENELNYDVVYGTDGSSRIQNEELGDDDDNVDELLQFMNQFNENNQNAEASEEQQFAGTFVAHPFSLQGFTADQLETCVRGLEWNDMNDVLSDVNSMMYIIGRKAMSRNTTSLYQRIVCHHSGQPAKGVTKSKKCGCCLSLNFKLKKWPGNDRETIRISDNITKPSVFVHSPECRPNAVIMEGNITFVKQLTAPMIDYILKSKTDVAPFMIRDSLQTQFKIEHIAIHVIRTVIRRSNEDAEAQSQVSRLLARLRATPNKYEVRGLWKRRKRDGGEVDELTNLMFATRRMLLMIKLYGGMIVVDATYKSNQFKRPLLIFTVRTSTGTFTIGAVAVLASENDACIGWAFEKLRSMIGEETWNNIRLVMTDGHLSYPKIVEQMPNATHQICWWHQTLHLKSTAKKYALGPWKAAWEMMRQATLKINVESQAIEKWHEMRRLFFTKPVKPKVPVPPTSQNATEPPSTLSKPSSSPQPFSMHNLTPTLSHVSHSTSSQSVSGQPTASVQLQAHAPSTAQVQSSTVTPAQKAAYDWLLVMQRLDKWFEDRRLYWRCYTQHYCNYGSVSTQGSESMNSVIKKRRRFMSMDDLIRAIENASSRHYWVMLNNIFNGQARKSIIGENIEMLNTLQQGVTAYAAGKLMEQFEFAQQAHEVGFQRLRDGLFVTKSRSHGDVRLDVVTRYCSCGLSDSMGLMCRHAMRYFLTVESLTSVKLANKCVEWANARWTMLNQDAIMQLSSEQVTESTELNQEQHETVNDDSMTVQIVQTSKNSSVLEMQDDWGRYQSLYRNEAEAHLLRTIFARALRDAQSQIEELRSQVRNDTISMTQSSNPPRDEINQSTINTLNRAGEPNISRNEADIYVNSPHASIHTENQASHSPTTSRITMPVTGTSTNLMHKRSNMVERRAVTMNLMMAHSKLIHPSQSVRNYVAEV